MCGCLCPEALSYGVLSWTREGFFQGFAKNKGEDQTVHLLSQSDQRICYSHTGKYYV